jgi:hypothetical protein
MSKRELFHIQLHPARRGEEVEYAEKGLAETHAIGLDFNPTVLKRRRLLGRPMSSFTNADWRALEPHRGRAALLMPLSDLKVGSIGLVRGGRRPVSLVRITGPSFYAKRGGRWGWYPYRYPVQILGWYDKSLKLWPDIRFMAPGPGTFQLLKGRTKTRRAIEKWLAHLGVPSDVANAAEDGPSRRGGAPGGSAPTNRKPNGQVTSRFVRGDHLDGREGYEVRTKAQARTAEAKEDELVQDFRRVLAKQGRSSGCLSYTLPDRKVFTAMCTSQERRFSSKRRARLRARM